MSESTDLQVVPEVESVRGQLQKINEFQAVIRNTLKEGHDYGIIPGTAKPTLLKSGAEKIFSLWGCRPRYTPLSETEDWDKPFFYFKYKCEAVNIKTGYVLAEGIRSCNSHEDKYGYRWVFDSEIPEGIDKNSLKTKWVFVKKAGKKVPMRRVINEDVATLVNTIQSMAQKRAYVSCALQMGALSDLFTQDLEDIHEVIDRNEPEPEPEPEKGNRVIATSEQELKDHIRQEIDEPKRGRGRPPKTAEAANSNHANAKVKGRIDAVKRWLKLEDADDVAIELSTFMDTEIENLHEWLDDGKNFQSVLDKLDPNKATKQVETENDDPDPVEQDIPF